MFKIIISILVVIGFVLQKIHLGETSKAIKIFGIVVVYTTVVGLSNLIVYFLMEAIDFDNVCTDPLYAEYFKYCGKEKSNESYLYLLLTGLMLVPLVTFIIFAIIGGIVMASTTRKAVEEGVTKDINENSAPILGYQY